MPGLGFLKVAVVVMGVLIVGGTAALVTLLALRGGHTGSATVPAVVTAVLAEPPGSRIAGIAALADRLAVQVQGGGADRVLLVDPNTGAVRGRISLAH
ncbi:DUF6476 family protein [Rhodopila globiformis]|nr:DUF6476 family protein [Rhodopila globiformis]